MKSTKQILGELLTIARNAAGLSIPQLAEKMNTSRAHITEIEAGTKNLTADLYDKLLEKCSVSAETAFAGLSTSNVPRDYADLYTMLDVIVKGGDKDLLFGIRINLQAVSEKAIRHRQARAPGQQQKGNTAPKEKKKQRAAEG